MSTPVVLLVVVLAAWLPAPTAAQGTVCRYTTFAAWTQAAGSDGAAGRYGPAFCENALWTPTQSVHWSFQGAGNIRVPRLTSDGSQLRVLIDGRSFASRLHAVDVVTGEELWTAAYDKGRLTEMGLGPADETCFGAQISSSASINAGEVHCVNRFGDALFSFETVDRVFMAPAITPGGLVIFGDESNRMYVVDLATGVSQHQLTFGGIGTWRGTPVLAPTGGQFFAVRQTGGIYKLDDDLGTDWTTTVLQTMTLPDPIALVDAIPGEGLGGVLFVVGRSNVDGRGVLTAFDENNGDELWQETGILEMRPLVSLDQRLVYFLRYNEAEGTTHLDARAIWNSVASEGWSWPFPDEPIEDIALTPDGAVLVTCTIYLVAFSAFDGSVLSARPVLAVSTPVPVSPGDAIYVTEGRDPPFAVQRRSDAILLEEPEPASISTRFSQVVLPGVNLATNLEPGFSCLVAGFKLSPSFQGTNVACSIPDSLSNDPSLYSTLIDVGVELPDGTQLFAPSSVVPFDAPDIFVESLDYLWSDDKTALDIILRGSSMPPRPEFLRSISIGDLSCDSAAVLEPFDALVCHLNFVDPENFVASGSRRLASTLPVAIEYERFGGLVVTSHVSATITPEVDSTKPRQASLLESIQTDIELSATVWELALDFVVPQIPGGPLVGPISTLSDANIVVTAPAVAVLVDGVDGGVIWSSTPTDDFVCPLVEAGDGILLGLTMAPGSDAMWYPAFQDDGTPVPLDPVALPGSGEVAVAPFGTICPRVRDGRAVAGFWDELGDLHLFGTTIPPTAENSWAVTPPRLPSSRWGEFFEWAPRRDAIGVSDTIFFWPDVACVLHAHAMGTGAELWTHTMPGVDLGGELPANAAVAPDGTLVVYACQVEDGDGLFVLDATDPSGPTVLYQDMIGSTAAFVFTMDSNLVLAIPGSMGVDCTDRDNLVAFNDDSIASLEEPWSGEEEEPFANLHVMTTSRHALRRNTVSEVPSLDNTINVVQTVRRGEGFEMFTGLRPVAPPGVARDGTAYFALEGNEGGLTVQAVTVATAVVVRPGSVVAFYGQGAAQRVITMHGRLEHLIPRDLNPNTPLVSCLVAGAVPGASSVGFPAEVTEFAATCGGLPVFNESTTLYDDDLLVTLDGFVEPAVIKPYPLVKAEISSIQIAGRSIEIRATGLSFPRPRHLETIHVDRIPCPVDELTDSAEYFSVLRCTTSETLAPGIHQLRILHAGNPLLSSDVVPFDQPVVAPPVISDVSPAAMPSNALTPITVSGTGFGVTPGTFQVFLDEILLDELWTTPTYMVVEVPDDVGAGDLSGQYPLRVVDPGTGMVNVSTISILGEFVPESLSPSTGAAGSTFTVRGTGFPTFIEARCQFRDAAVPATVVATESAVVLDSTTASCQAPSSPATVGVELAVDIGFGNGEQFTYEPVSNATFLVGLPPDLITVFPTAAESLTLTAITVVGGQFFDRPELLCRVNEADFPAVFVHSGIVVCQVSWSGRSGDLPVAVANDGVDFGGGRTVSFFGRVGELSVQVQPPEVYGGTGAISPGPVVSVLDLFGELVRSAGGDSVEAKIVPTTATNATLSTTLAGGGVFAEAVDGSARFDSLVPINAVFGATYFLEFSLGPVMVVSAPFTVRSCASIDSLTVENPATGGLDCACVPGTDDSRGGGECAACAAGLYNSVIGGECRSCPPFSTTVASGASSLDECVCAAGYEFDGTTGGCTECEVGTYKQAVSSTVTCSACPVNAVTADTGSTSPSACVCAAGHFLLDGVCTECPVESFKPGIGSDAECLGRCPENTEASAPGATGIDDCACQPGLFRAISGECEACEIGTYKAVASDGPCVDCPSNTTTAAAGADTVDECLCGPGRFGSGESCQPCSVGTYKASTGSALCQPCPDGTLTLSSGASDVSDCACAPGRFLSDGACVLCDTESYKPDAGSSPCLACPANSEAASEGSTSVVSCTCKPDFYLDEAGDCVPCPGIGALCPGGGDIVVQEGFWVDGSSPEFVAYECAAGRCRRGGSCTTGYTGVLCGICAKDFGRQGDACLKCAPQAVNYFVAVMAVLIAVAVVIFMIQTADKPGSLLTVFSKVLVNFVQVLASLGDFAVRWPAAIAATFGVGSAVSGSSDMLAVNCLADPSFYDHLLVGMLLPGVVVCLAFVGCVVHKAVTRSASFKQLFRTSIFVVLFLIHPMVTRAVSRSFRCVDVGSGSFLASDLRESCETSQYKAWLGVSVVYFIVYCVGLPLLLVGLTARGFVLPEVFSSGYTESRKYWEFVVTFRKILIVLVSVVFDPDIQLVLGSLLVVGSLLLEISFNPFESPLVARVERSLLSCLYVTLTLGIVFYLDSVSVAVANALAVATIVVNAGAVATAIGAVGWAHRKGGRGGAVAGKELELL